MRERLLLPCLRGAIGNWVTYTCLMRLSDIKELISFADDLHKNKELSKLIQRQLKKDRQKEIGEYILQNEEAFFNSLVVAVYEGEPKWHQFDAINQNTQGIDKYEAPDYATESMGYLSLSREEKIFALDGQHRLAGIQYAVELDEDKGYMQLPVTFLAHFNDEDGLKRTRRLFTTLNKKAKPVDKAAIISLDEDDICACASRFMVEEANVFNNGEIKIQANNNVAYSDTKILTTIGNLYDLIKVLLLAGSRLSRKQLDNFRGSYDERIRLFELVESVFDYILTNVAPLAEFKNADSEDERENIVLKYRNKENGGHFLFRPVGLRLYFLAMVKCAKGSDDFLSTCRAFIDRTKDMDLWLESNLLKDKVWNSETKTIINFKADIRNEIVATMASYGLTS